MKEAVPGIGDGNDVMRVLSTELIKFEMLTRSRP